MNSLTYPLLSSYGAVFTDCYNLLSNNYIGDSRKKIMTFVYETILKTPIYSVTTVESLKLLRNRVFGDVEIRDFVLSLTTHFYSRIVVKEGFSCDESHFILCEYLSNGLTVSDCLSGTVFPTELSDRLPLREDNVTTLKNNKWLVVIAMLLLFSAVTDGSKS